MEVVCDETWNTYDLVTLILIAKEYLKQNYIEDVFDDENDGKMKVAVIKDIDIDELLKIRGVKHISKRERQTMINSIKRIFMARVSFTDLEEESTIFTKYIYHVKIEKNRYATIHANLGFIKKILNSGVLINIEKLAMIKGNYETLLFVYIEATKKKIEVQLSKRKKINVYGYRERYSFDEIEKAMKLDLTDLTDYEKLRIMRECFSYLHKDKFIETEYRVVKKKRKEVKGDGKRLTDKYDIFFERKYHEHEKLLATV